MRHGTSPHPDRRATPDNGLNVLAYSDGVGWWQANYYPAADDSGPNDGIAGWYLLGIEDEPIHPIVTHWLPMPRSPKD